jgi:aldose 1-epimerase
MSPVYSVRQSVVDGVEVVQLADSTGGVEVSIATAVGNMAYELKSGGKNFLWFPFNSPAELRAKPTLCGIPFLAPWANRIDGDTYWANGKQYRLNFDLGNFRRDGHQKPIHGLLNYSPLWQRVAADADANSAWVSSRLEFFRHPEMMAQFPFAHTITMTHRLASGALEVETAIENHSTEPMPLAIGFHPYFCVHDAPRDAWKVHLAARDHLVLNDALIPTGERKPIEFADPYPVIQQPLDDVFSGLVRDADGRARFYLQGARQRVTVAYGPRYPVAVVYAPAGRDYVCFEPMAGPTNVYNLAHAGQYDALQSVPPAATWRESFWITVAT